MNNIFVLNIDAQPKEWSVDSKRQPCPSCGVNESSNCKYGEYDYFGEFDCTHKNSGNLEWTCEACPELACEKCKS